MKLSRINLSNYRGFASATIDFDSQMTVIVGVNGAGKTSLLDAASMALGTAAVELLPPGLVIPTLAPRDIGRGADRTMVNASVAVGVERAEVTLTATRHGALAILDARAPALRALPGVDHKPSSCLALYFTTARAASPDLHARWKDGASEATEELDAIVGALGTASPGFDDLFRWFRDREDQENAEKVRRASLAWSDPQLDAVRAAVSAMLPGFSTLRVDRAALRMVVAKGGDEFSLDQLSDGERTLLSVVADIARRLAIANPSATDALQCEAVVLIDEVELHLHPAWQRDIVKRLPAVFPRTQFILTTHSPQVLGELHARNVRVLRNFVVEAPPAETWGRDSNRILAVLMGANARSEAIEELFAALSVAEDEERWGDAWAAIDALVAQLGGDDPDVTRRAAMLPARDADQTAPESR